MDSTRVYALVIVIITVAQRCDAVFGNLAGTRETCEDEGAIVKIDDIPNTKCFGCICKNGLVECTKRQCPSTEGCYAILLTSQRDDDDDECCRKCRGCVRNGAQHPSGTRWTEPDDPCKIFICDSGIITVTTLRCTAPCPKPISARLGECCPTCGGCRIDAAKILEKNPCITCRCDEGRTSCTEEVCPVLNCPASRIHRETGKCCPSCRGRGEFLPPPKGGCMIGTEMHKSGAEFRLDRCTRCSCADSTLLCVKEACPTKCTKVEADETMPAIIDDRWCCPRCVKDRGVCTVFGDPHYKTFDGKLFTFKGTCRYQLVADCADRSFSVRVSNDARSSETSSWTKTIALKIGPLRIMLGQKMRVKVNGTSVELPYRVADNALDISRTRDSVVVRTEIGIQLVWDGISFAEVTASSLYRGRLCGLCGNFDSRPEDDFTTRRGFVVEDSHRFGESWAVGPRRDCPPIRAGVKKLRRDEKMCDRLRSNIFEPCAKKLDPTTYLESCLQDMSECPTKRCYCESFVAYAHECQRNDVRLPKWRISTGCSIASLG